MLAKRMPSILPPMSVEESLETTRIYSVASCRETPTGLMIHRPFRSPHHTISEAALAGGGSIPVPGEISLAHNGVLFLDELTEFKRSLLEVMRQPLEERRVRVSMAKMTLEFPAAFMLLASMNSCPCGYYCHPQRLCNCTQKAISTNRGKISGPLLDRIDLHIEAEAIPFQEFVEEDGESSAIIRERVIRATELQSLRFANRKNIYSNEQMTDRDLAVYCPTEKHAKRFLLVNMQAMQLSARAYGRILKVARTLADLAGSETLELDHIAEAMHYRSLDKAIRGSQ
jgi:magnesium chelatase family protein